MTKNEILENHFNTDDIAPHDLQQIYKAMSEYADQECIAFAEWLRKFAWQNEDGDSWEYNNGGISKHCLSDSEMYAIFKQRNNK